MTPGQNPGYNGSGAGNSGTRSASWIAGFPLTLLRQPPPMPAVLALEHNPDALLQLLLFCDASQSGHAGQCLTRASLPATAPAFFEDGLWGIRKAPEQEKQSQKPRAHCR